MQNAIRITNGGTGRIDHQGRRPLVHRTGYDGPGKKKTAVTGERNAFLTSRFIPIAEDYLVEDETGGACVNLTTSENFDYLYRSALRYADLMNVRLPFLARKGSGPRINITALYKALDETLPEHVNLEERAGRLHFCLYRFHDWPDHTLFWLPVDFTESLPVPLRRIVREFIRQFVRYHGLNAVTETWYYELAVEELDDWKNRDPEASPQTIRKYKRLAESYQSGKIAKTLKRMEGKPFCTDLEEKVRKYRAAVKEERELLELIREGMGLITPGNPCIMQYGYDWAYERSPDFLPIDLDCQIMLAYSNNGKYSINSLVYWVTYVHNVVYSFYRSMIYCYINSTQRCAGSIVIDIIPTNGADKRKFFPFAPYFPVTNVIKRYFYPYFPAIIGIKGYSFPYFPYLSGIMKIKTALYSLFSRLDWHKTVVFPCLGEIYEGIRSLSWEIPVT